MIPTILVVATTALLAGTTLWSARKPISTALIVPLVWLVTIPVQSVVLASKLGFAGAPRTNMYIAVAVANAGFAGYQLLSSFGVVAKLQQEAAQWLRIRDTSLAVDGGHVRYWFGGLLVIAVGLAVLHWALMPSIPLVQLLQGVDANQLQVARENSAKLLAAPPLLKYAFSWDSRIILPILLITAVLSRWRWAALFVAVFGLVYIASPLERLPAMLFVLGPFVAIAIRDSKHIWSPVVIAGVAAALIPAYLITEGIAIDQAHQPASSAAPVSSPAPTPSQDQTSMSLGFLSHLPGPVATALDLALRRTGEAPTDVTYQWFAYFPEHHPFLYGSGWEPWHVLRSGYQTPANMVGVWAYYGKQGYELTSITAYASFIADGWAEFGILGAVIATLLLLALCAGLDIVRGLGRRPFLLACYVAALVLVTADNPQAGLPAMVLSSGVWLVPVLCAGYLLTDGRSLTIRGPRLAKQPTTP